MVSDDDNDDDRQYLYRAIIICKGPCLAFTNSNNKRAELEDLILLDGFLATFDMHFLALLDDFNRSGRTRILICSQLL